MAHEAAESLGGFDPKFKPEELSILRELSKSLSEPVTPGRIPSRWLAQLVVAAAEDRQEQEEYVQDVEEDRRSEEWSGADALGAAQPLEVE